jgi:PEP-CTERM motif
MRTHSLRLLLTKLIQNGGVTLLNAGLDIRGSFVGANPSDTQSAINLGPIAGPAGAGFYDFMRVDANFSMAGGSDAYTWNGIATVVVPEPTTALLLVFGLGGLARFGRRR